MTDSNKIIAIHQPDFMPWLGFFNKIIKSDVMVILDHVANNPRDGFWCRRVMMAINKQKHWITIPVVAPKDRVFVPLNEMEINVEDQKTIKKLLKTIRENYSKAPFFNEVVYLVDNYFNDDAILLAERNLKFINEVCGKLDIKRNFIRSSSLNCEGKATDLLIEICKKVNADTYICGGGAQGYQEDELFKKQGIKLEYLNFEQPIYNQFNANEFLPGLSIIDVLMNCGFEQTKKLLSF